MLLKKIPVWVLFMVLIIIILSVIIIYIERFTLPTPKVADGLTAIISAFIGILITIAVTSMLLNKQTAMETNKEKGIIQFKQKQDTYLSFLKQFESIMVSLTERNIKGNDCKAYENVIKLESLLFEFGYLRIHMKEELFCEIMERITNIFKKYRSIHLYSLYQEEIVKTNRGESPKLNTSLYNLMMDISENLLIISEKLHKDLYGSDEVMESKQVNNFHVQTHNLLIECGLTESNEA